MTDLVPPCAGVPALDGQQTARPWVGAADRHRSASGRHDRRWDRAGQGIADLVFSGPAGGR